MSIAEVSLERARRVRAARRVRRVLLISYHFPPVGGGGVQRSVKFAKYLRKFGWEVSVLAASNPSVPVYDESLVRDIPDGLTIERARTWEPGYGLKQTLAAGGPRSNEVGELSTLLKRSSSRVLRSAASVVLQPDPQVLWVPEAARAGSRLLGRLRHDVILATAPAYSNLLLGALLKQRFGIPLVVDFRDEWDISASYLENAHRDRATRAVQQWMQRYVLRRSDAILATTKATAATLKARAEQAGSHAPATCIYNGYDEADFRPDGAGEVDVEPKQGFRIVYTGTLWNLTNVEPLVKAVEALGARDSRALSRLELVFVGRRTPEQDALVKRLKGSPCRLRVEEYCSHNVSLAWAASADALCMLLSDVAEASRVIPAKLFEYLRMRKEILAIAPDGEAVDIVRERRAGADYRPGDIEGIVNWLLRRASRPAAHGATLPAASTMKQFSRERLTEQLAEILDALADSTADQRAIRAAGERHGLGA